MKHFNKILICSLLISTVFLNPVASVFIYLTYQLKDCFDQYLLKLDVKATDNYAKKLEELEKEVKSLVQIQSFKKL